MNASLLMRPVHIDFWHWTLKSQMNCNIYLPRVIIDEVFRAVYLTLEKDHSLHEGQQTDRHNSQTQRERQEKERRSSTAAAYRSPVEAFF